jgi:hypothetical protein
LPDRLALNRAEGANGSLAEFITASRAQLGILGATSTCAFDCELNRNLHFGLAAAPNVHPLASLVKSSPSEPYHFLCGDVRTAVGKLLIRRRGRR